MVKLSIAEPVTLPCGLTLPNRLAKAAMAENWGDKKQLSDKRLIEAYGAWADGGWGMGLTGNVQIDVAFQGSKKIMRSVNFYHTRSFSQAGSSGLP